MPDLPPLSLLAPPLLLVAALVLAARPGRRPPAVGWLPQGAALVALALVAAGPVPGASLRTSAGVGWR